MIAVGMITVNRRRFLTFCLAGVSLARRPTLSAQVFDSRELSDYRLTEPVFKRFAHATRLLADAMARDPRFSREPLITREISVEGDAVEMANALRSRLDADASLSTALFAADISSREYAAFAIALFAARLASGFVKSGAMRRVPAGVATENVAFIATHEKEVAALMKQLRLE